MEKILKILFDDYRKPLQEPSVEAEISKTTKAQKVFELCKSKACSWYCMLKYFSQIEKV